MWHLEELGIFVILDPHVSVFNFFLLLFFFLFFFGCGGGEGGKGIGGCA